ncbi:MAG: hypothetical protein JNK05_24160 [Myxococcales bacterium]|nr:hypothetical protein [Myxococcales bacterium]
MSTHNAPPRIFVTTLAWLAPGGREALSTFRARAGGLFAKHDLRVERTLVGHGKGQLVGSNPHDVPDVLQVFSLPSLDAFSAYTKDPEYVRLASERDAGVARLTAIIGDVLPDDPSSASVSDVRRRLYAMAFVRFHPGGDAAMAEFNAQAQTLFARHGMHIERTFRVAKTVTPVGAPLADFAPERVVVFFVDDPSALRAYATDPEYTERAAARDRGLRAYDFFLGTEST